MTNDKFFTKIAAAFGLWPDKAEGYALYNFFLVFRSTIKVWEEGNINTPPIQLMRPKADRKQIHEFGNNTVNKLIVIQLFLGWEGVGIVKRVTCHIRKLTF